MCICWGRQLLHVFCFITNLYYFDFDPLRNDDETTKELHTTLAFVPVLPHDVGAPPSLQLE
jgi:hypothetical protein